MPQSSKQRRGEMIFFMYHTSARSSRAHSYRSWTDQVKRGIGFEKTGAGWCTGGKSGLDLWRCDRYVGAMTVVLGAATKIFLIFMLCLQAQAADRVRLGYSSITANRLPLWLGQEAGIFARHGIDAELLLIPSGTTGVQALVAGEVQILSATGSTGVAAALRG